MAKNKPASMADFNTVDACERGVTIEIDLPDGSPSGRSLTIVGVDSRKFREVKAKYRREYAAVISDDDSVEGVAEVAEARHKIEARQLAELVVGWTFDEALTHESVTAFLESAPLIKNQIDRVVLDRALFLKKSPKS